MKERFLWPDDDALVDAVYKAWQRVTSDSGRIPFLCSMEWTRAVRNWWTWITQQIAFGRLLQETPKSRQLVGCRFGALVRFDVHDPSLPENRLCHPQLRHVRRHYPARLGSKRRLACSCDGSATFRTGVDATRTDSGPKRQAGGADRVATAASPGSRRPFAGAPQDRRPSQPSPPGLLREQLGRRQNQGDGADRGRSQARDHARRHHPRQHTGVHCSTAWTVPPHVACRRRTSSLVQLAGVISSKWLVPPEVTPGKVQPATVSGLTMSSAARLASGTLA
jgi:hypothetical protein